MTILVLLPTECYPKSKKKMISKNFPKITKKPENFTRSRRAFSLSLSVYFISKIIKKFTQIRKIEESWLVFIIYQENT